MGGCTGIWRPLHLAGPALPLRLCMVMLAENYVSCRLDSISLLYTHNDRDPSAAAVKKVSRHSRGVPDGFA